MSNIAGVYSIKNQINHKAYIGSSNNVENRFKTHLRLLSQGIHHSPHLQKAWDKYGAGNFEFKVIKGVEQADNLVTEEQHWIDFFDSANSEKGYNIAPKASSLKGLNFTSDGYLFWINKSYVGMLNQEGSMVKYFTGIPLPEETSFSDIGRLIFLVGHLLEDTNNMLAYRENDRIYPMTTIQISEVTKLKSHQSSAFIRRMIQHGIIAKNIVEIKGKKETQYYINPIYFFSGNRISLNLYLIFRKQLDVHIPGWVIHRFSEEASKTY